MKNKTRCFSRNTCSQGKNVYNGVACPSPKLAGCSLWLSVCQASVTGSVNTDGSDGDGWSDCVRTRTEVLTALNSGACSHPTDFTVSVTELEAI